MKWGVSSYSLARAIMDNRMTILDVVSWVAEAGGEHIEIVPIGFSLTDDPGLADRIREKARETGIQISNYAIGANFIQPDAESLEREIKRVMKEVEVAARLGATRMRHDVASRPIGDTSLRRFLDDLPMLAEACGRIADTAAPYGITTSVENHGYFVQASERVQLLVSAVARDNYRTTLDIGNFLCVDEDPVVAVARNLGIASMVHFKDFYVRPSNLNPGEGWFPSASGNYLRGAIVGHGDIDLRRVMRVIRQSQYDGFASIEFEGMEDCLSGTRIALANAKRIWDEVS